MSRTANDIAQLAVHIQDGNTLLQLICFTGLPNVNDQERLELLEKHLGGRLTFYSAPRGTYLDEMSGRSGTRLVTRRPTFWRDTLPLHAVLQPGEIFLGVCPLGAGGDDSPSMIPTYLHDLFDVLVNAGREDALLFVSSALERFTSTFPSTGTAPASLLDGISFMKTTFLEQDDPRDGGVHAWAHVWVIASRFQALDLEGLNAELEGQGIQTTDPTAFEEGPGRRAQVILEHSYKALAEAMGSDLAKSIVLATLRRNATMLSEHPELLALLCKLPCFRDADTCPDEDLRKLFRETLAEPLLARIMRPDMGSYTVPVVQLAALGMWNGISAGDLKRRLAERLARGQFRNLNNVLRMLYPSELLSDAPTDASVDPSTTEFQHQRRLARTAQERRLVAELMSAAARRALSLGRLDVFEYLLKRGRPNLFNTELHELRLSAAQASVFLEKQPITEPDSVERSLIYDELFIA